MVGMASNENWPLVRFIAPMFPALNVFTRYAKEITSLGLIMVATAANKLWGWRVEVIDENNYTGPRDSNGLPDHRALQRENPASAVGFYCGLTSTMDRVFELAELYHSQGAVNIAGGWHVRYCPEEALNKNIDIVVQGEGEQVIGCVLRALQEGKDLSDIRGISFRRDAYHLIISSDTTQVHDLDSLPYPDFGLLRHGGRTNYYPIGRIRGCRMNCEFCSVKGEPRWACAKHLFKTVEWLVETRRARRFFIVDDRLEGDIAGTLEFFRMIAAKFGDSLRFTVQIRLEAAKNTEFLEAMKNGGVKVVCVGYESPIDGDLKTMRKGYLSAEMIRWTKILRRYFWVHGMFIFGYPSKGQSSSLDVRQMADRFKRFIRSARIDSIQIMHPVPLVGTELRSRLEKEDRIFPNELVPWAYYDGNYACFIPDGMSLAELQETPHQIMRWFYSPLSFMRISLRIIAFPVDFLIRGWHRWHRGWIRDVINYGGHLLVKRWQKRQENGLFLEKLEDYVRNK